ncbi:Acyl-CoA synthetase [Streptomyces hygroscopicus subsp. limoneus]|nr:Acyl-CoA synthetase [Streptomyces hygroscopicus subsp. limoneus]
MWLTSSISFRTYDEGGGTPLAITQHHGPFGGYRPPRISGLHDVIDTQVRDRPDAPTLVLGEARETVSYRTLADLADELARRLLAAGLHPHRPVGLVSADNLEFVVALLGAARAGLVLAPVDPALPEAERRRRYTALEAQAVLTGVPVPPPAPPVGGPPHWPLTVCRSGDGRYGVALDAGTTPDDAPHGAADRLTGDDALAQERGDRPVRTLS